MSKQDTKGEETESVTDLDDSQRRQLLTRAARLAVYTAPTITVLTFASSLHAQIGSPPDPPPTAEDMRKKPPNRR